MGDIMFMSRPLKKEEVFSYLWTIILCVPFVQNGKSGLKNTWWIIKTINVMHHVGTYNVQWIVIPSSEIGVEEVEFCDQRRLAVK